MSSKPASVSRASRQSAGGMAEERDYVLRIDLDGSRPPIWRRVQVPGSFTLSDLHTVIQNVFEWDDSHLHAFTVAGADFGLQSREKKVVSDGDESHLTLRELFPRAGMKFRYDYDFSNSWVHTITVEKIQPTDPDQPRIPNPPENCGGIYSFMEMVEALRSSEESGLSRKDLAEIRARLGKKFDPARFSVEEANRKLQSVFGAGTSIRPASAGRKEAGKKNTRSATSRTTGSRSDKYNESERVWAGTVIDTADVAGLPLTHNGKAPVVAVWFDVTDPLKVRPVSFLPGFADSSEHPLIQALFSPEPGLQRPTRLVAATMADLEILRSHSFEGMSIDRETMPEIAEQARDLISNVAQTAAQLGGLEGRPSELRDLLPVPGEPGVDEALARAWCEATLAFWKARPWKKTSDQNLFELAFPDGEKRLATVIGQGGESYGILMFATEDDFQRFYDFASQVVSSSFPSPDSEFPVILSLNFDDPEALPAESTDYMAKFGPQWKSQSTRPFVMLVVGLDTRSSSARDFVHTAQAAAALARLAQEKAGWPPRPGTRMTVEIPWLSQTAQVQVRAIRG